VLFPIAARAQQRAQGGEEDGEQPRRKRRAESNLHSTDLWHLPGGATGEQCYEIVKEKTLAKRAKVSEAAQRKAARAETRKSAHASANELGATICANLQSDADMKKLKVPELKAAMFASTLARFRSSTFSSTEYTKHPSTASSNSEFTMRPRFLFFFGTFLHTSTIVIVCSFLNLFNEERLKWSFPVKTRTSLTTSDLDLFSLHILRIASFSSLVSVV